MTLTIDWDGKDEPVDRDAPPRPLKSLPTRLQQLMTSESTIAEVLTRRTAARRLPSELTAVVPDEAGIAELLTALAT